MAKSKHTPEFRAMVSQEYLDGVGSYENLADKYHVGCATIRKWMAAYRYHEIEAFAHSVGNRCYSREFKIKCIEEVLHGQGSVIDIAAKNNFSPSILWRWISLYNANRELKDYDPKREVYMADARRKTTLEERKEIAEYCLSHDRDYKGTAGRFDVSYSQVYSWVKKYDIGGEDALTDKRGHHKTDDELDEIERLRRENQRLKRKLQESEMANQLLKKVKEFERK